jgi:hypothetical protein
MGRLQMMSVTAIALSERGDEKVGAGEADIPQHEVVEPPDMVFGVLVASGCPKTALHFSARCCSAGRREPPCENTQGLGFGAEKNVKKVSVRAPVGSFAHCNLHSLCCI